MVICYKHRQSFVRVKSGAVDIITGTNLKLSYITWGTVVMKLILVYFLYCYNGTQETGYF